MDSLASQNPGLSEGIEIAQLAPQFNKRRELKDIKGADSITKLREINRLGLSNPERPDAVPTYEQVNVDKINACMAQYLSNETTLDHLKDYPTHIATDNIHKVRSLLPADNAEPDIGASPNTDGLSPSRR